MKKILFILVILGLLAWWLNSRPSPIGTYVAKHHMNTIDTIVIMNGGIYKQSIYRKDDGKKVFQNEGKWIYKEGRIRFSNFFQSDDVARKDNYNYDNVLLTFSTELETSFLGQPVFDYEEEVSIYRYYKVLW